MEVVADSATYLHGGLSLLDMFVQSSVVVKLVMIVLVVFSMVSWAVVFKKAMVLRKHKREVEDIEVTFNSRNMNTSLREVLECSSGLVPRILQHGIRNARLLQNKKEGFHRFVDAELSRSILHLESNLELLAMIGSSAPFVGLLGSIWKIVEVLGIGPIAKATNAAALLPGISEALYTTVLALMVAIPAKIFHSIFAARVSKMSSKLGHLVYELGTFVANE
ncbi:biopolymer transport protein ExbB [Anaplasma platys]|uniref:Biopolymer transport protein ExbB n=1 Tax=Anaplasma platys TaxID=949 RepID=A0A858PYV3_9RICK|nr:MotA/TolQ/ExbB proton channel family protein [Anaplasma platys]QJC27744.1 biopolymer transport protein ExbB [Anaplasma platys]